MSHNMKEALKLLAFVVAMAIFGAVSPIGLNLIVFAVVLSFLVCIHELGHYIWFKRAGVVVEEFAIGMGKPVIASFILKNGERWSFRALLIGGYVKPQGGETADGEPKPGDYKSATPWGRMKAILAGPLVNIVFAFVALTAALMLPTSNNIEVDLVVVDSPAHAAGVEVFDDVIAINGTPVSTGDEYRAAMEASPTTTVTFTFEKEDGSIYDATIAQNEDGNYGFMATHTRSGGPGFGPVKAVTTSADVMVNAVPNFAKAVKAMVVGTDTPDAPEGGDTASEGEQPEAGMAGPNKFGEIMRTQMSGGLFAFLTTMASLSLVLGVSNLIPLLPLDGGHVVATAAEMLGKPIPEKVQNIASAIVAIPLMLATFVWLFWDIIELFI